MPRTDWSQGWVEYHTIEDPCNHQRWCRLHWWPGFDEHGARMPMSYPFTLNVLSSRNGWQRVDVCAGPGAFYPKRPPVVNSKQDISDRWYPR